MPRCVASAAVARRWHEVPRFACGARCVLREAGLHIAGQLHVPRQGWPGSGHNVHRRRLGRDHRVCGPRIHRQELQFSPHRGRWTVFQGGGWSQVAGAAARRRLAGAGSGVDGGDGYRLHERGPGQGEGCSKTSSRTRRSRSSAKRFRRLLCRCWISWPPTPGRPCARR